MIDLRALMARLDGAAPDSVNRIAGDVGSLPVRLAMLGLASSRRSNAPLWWGYPPGVFIGYKWDGAPMRARVTELASRLRSRGYRPFLDVENLDAEADAYFRIPAYIASLQDCHYYLLLLTAASAAAITAREGRTSWIFDEYQHAVRCANAGRLFIVPVLLEPGGTTDFFTPANAIDLCGDPNGFDRLGTVLPDHPLRLPEEAARDLTAAMQGFDRLFLAGQWDASARLLHEASRHGATFDHRFRRLLHAIYTADRGALDAVLPALHAEFGAATVRHLYRGYCASHGIPERTTAE